MTIDNESDIQQIKDALVKNNYISQDNFKVFHYFNQIEKVDDRKKIKDVFHSGDMITIHMGNTPPLISSGNGINWNNLRSINNESGGKVNLILKTKICGNEIPFTEDKWDSIDFSKWRNSVEICWYLFI